MRSIVWLESRPAVSWGLALVYAVVIFCFSSVPYLEQLVGLPAGLSVVEHVVEYLLFGFLVAVAFGSRGVYGFLPAFLTSCLYGASDEMHQFFVSGRNASMVDVLADSLGCLIGIFAYRRFRK